MSPAPLGPAQPCAPLLLRPEVRAGEAFAGGSAWGQGRSRWVMGLSRQGAMNIWAAGWASPSFRDGGRAHLSSPGSGPDEPQGPPSGGGSCLMPYLLPAV